MKIARVFPRRTNATPTDELSFVGDPPGLFIPEFDKGHISVTFTWDIKEAERLKKEWSQYAPIEIGGPATGMRGEQFEPGVYLKLGYTITSRGCRNRCWFCSVWKREGAIRELEIKPGVNILDDNLLACSDYHVQKVFEMMLQQKGRKQFTGGLEAAILKPWHVDWLKKIKPYQIFFAYDTPDDREPLFEAGKMLLNAGISKSSLRAYVLIGYPMDTMEDAEIRLKETLKAGFVPMAMLYKDDFMDYRKEMGDTVLKWRRFQRLWARPAVIRTKIKNKVLDL